MAEPSIQMNILGLGLAAPASHSPPTHFAPHEPAAGGGGSSKLTCQVRPLGSRNSAAATMNCADSSRSNFTSVRVFGYTVNSSTLPRLSPSAVLSSCHTCSNDELSSLVSVFSW